MIGPLRCAAFFLILAFAMTLPSCKGRDTHEKIMTDNLSLLEKAATIIESVDDGDSAKKASKELEKLNSKFRQIGERTKAIGRPDAETAKTLREDYSKRSNKVIARLTNASSKAAEKGPEIEEALKAIGESLKNLR